jgi:hypothetical protein
MTRILFRGDGHYARPEAMTWCEENGVDYVFRLPGTKPLSRKVDETADAVRTERAIGDKDVVRGFADPRNAIPLYGTYVGFPSDHLGMEVQVSVMFDSPKG